MAEANGYDRHEIERGRELYRLTRQMRSGGAQAIPAVGPEEEALIYLDETFGLVEREENNRRAEAVFPFRGGSSERTASPTHRLAFGLFSALVFATVLMVMASIAYPDLPRQLGLVQLADRVRDFVTGGIQRGRVNNPAEFSSYGLTKDEKALFKALQTGDTDAVRELIAKGVDVNCTDGKGYLPLRFAQDAEAALLLLDAGSGFAPERPGFDLPIDEAVRQDRSGVVKLLLERGPYPQDHTRMSRLACEAIESDAWDTAWMLLEGGQVTLNSEKGRIYSSPLRTAIWRGENAEALKAVKWMIDHGAAVDEKDQDGDTPLHAAAEYLNIPAARMLLKAGANPNADNLRGRTPTDVIGHKMSIFQSRSGTLAAKEKELEKLLAEYGGRLSVNAAEAQEERQKELDSWDDDGGRKHEENPLADKLSELQAYPGREDEFFNLLDQGGYSEDQIFTAIHFAARYNDVKILEALLLHDPQCTLRSRQQQNGGSPLFAAIGNYQTENANLLYENGAVLIAPGSIFDLALGDSETLARELEKDPAKAAEFCHDGLTSLHFAAALNRAENARLLIASGADPDHPGTRGATPAHFAAVNGSTEALGVLIESGADLITGLTVSPFNFAAQRDHVETMKLMVKAGYDPFSEKDGSMLYTVALYGKTAAAGYLIDLGFKADAEDPRGQYPLIGACMKNHADTARLLIANGADVRFVTSKGQTAVSMAAGGGSPDTLRLVLELGADPDTRDPKTGYAPLHKATKGRFSEPADLARCVSALLEYGADPSATGFNGLTPLDLIGKPNSPEMQQMADMLAAAGGRYAVNSADGFNERACDDATDAARWGCLHQLRCLIENGADPNQANSLRNGTTPLVAAARYGQVEAIRLLLEAGSDPNQPDPKGTYALERVFQSDRAEAAALLLRGGARLDLVPDSLYASSPTQDNKTWCRLRPVHYAARYGSVELLDILLSQGIDVNDTHAEDLPPNQTTPLCLAAISGQHDAVEFLLHRGGKLPAGNELAELVIRNDTAQLKARLEAGADPRRQRGQTPWPLLFAYSLGNDEAVELLTRFGANLELTRICMEFTPFEYRVEFPHLAALQYIDTDATPEQMREMVELTLLKDRWEAQDFIHGTSALVLSAAERGYTGVLEQLSADFDDPNHVVRARDRSFNTALHYAAREGQVETVKLLLKLGAKPTAKNSDGQTPLDVALDDATEQALLQNQRADESL